MIKEGLKDEFKRHEHTALMQVIKSVSITFDRNQLKSLLKLRVSMEKTIIETGGPKNAVEEQLQCLELLNTILMDIEDINQDKAEWIGSEVMNKRLAQMRREAEKKADEEALAKHEREHDHYVMHTRPYRTRNPKDGSLHELSSSVIEVVVKKSLNMSSDNIVNAAEIEFNDLINANEIKVESGPYSKVNTPIKRKNECEYIYEFDPVAIVEILK